jgi:DNA-binding NtrC family response regulator
LYYRLSIFPIQLPPLRERPDDIVLLATALLERVAPQRKLGISAAALQLLQMQGYPGNVRELRNLLERTALLCDGSTIELTHVQQALLAGRRSVPVPLKDGALKTVERAALQQLVNAHQGSRGELARQLGISERSLYRKLKSL